MRSGGERGAAAVEFAIVLPVLLAIVLGTIDFGYAFFVQGTAAGAAREGVREFAIHKNASAATATATSLMPSGIAGVSASVGPSGCPIGQDATMTVSWTVTSITGFYAALLNGTGSYQAVMRCGG